MEYNFICRIRNIFETLVEAFNRQCNIFNISESYAPMFLSDQIINNLNNYNDIMDNFNIEFKDIALTRITTSCMHLVLITDLYKKLNYLIIQNDIYPVNKSMLEQIKNAIQNNKTSELISNTYLFKEMKNALIEFDDAAGMDKVLQIKALSKKDIELINSFNPFFIHEYKHFDVIINAEFFNKHLSIWVNHFGEDEAYKKMSEFLINLLNVNIITLNDLLNELFDEKQIDDVLEYINDNNIEALKEVIKNYYTNIKDKIREKK